MLVYMMYICMMESPYHGEAYAMVVHDVSRNEGLEKT
jgi:hypothetical protein